MTITHQDKIEFQLTYDFNRAASLMKIEYNPESGLASLQMKGGINLATVVSRPGRSLPTELAFLLASYSRRKDSLIEIMGSSSILSGDNQEALDGARRIIDGYGHGSVRGLGHLVGFIEGIPILSTMRIFNYLPLQDGQELSNRYVEVAEGEMADRCYIPDLPEEREEGYRAILNHWGEAYKRLLPKSETALREVFNIREGEHKGVLKCRTLDMVRYLIPLAYRSRMGLIQSGREWSRLIRYLASSKWEEHIAEGLLHLFKSQEDNYKAEGENLIRHTDAQWDPTDDLLRSVPLRVSKHLDLLLGRQRVTRWESYYPLPMRYQKDDTPLLRYLLLMEPLLRDAGINRYNAEEFYTKLWRLYEGKEEMPIQCRAGRYSIHGMADLGSLKDLNRHRDMSYLPLLADHYDIYRDLRWRRTVSDSYTLCPYLYMDYPIMKALRSEYEEAMNTGYRLILKWLEGAPAPYHIKLLLPQGHLAPYILSGSPARWDYLCRLRSKPGGHISYRLLSQEFARRLASVSPIFSRIPTVDIESREEFLDRS